MPFKKKAGFCTVYEYGCGQPTAGLIWALQQMELRCQLWNKFVKIEQAYQAGRAAYLTIENSPVPELSKQLEAVRSEIKHRRQDARGNGGDLTALVTQAQTLRQELTQAIAEEKEARSKREEQYKEQLDTLKISRYAAVKEAKQESPLYWCNKEDVERSYEVARVQVRKRGQELQFHKWLGEGKIAIRYQNGLPVAQVFGDDGRLQIEPVSAAAWTSPLRRERRQLCRTIVRIRACSDGRQPCWLELPLMMHRPLPENACIRSAAVCRERVADCWRYKLVITVETPPPTLKNMGGTVSIDGGWRLLRNKNGNPAGLRVAYWYDDDEEEDQLTLDQEFIEHLQKIDALKQERTRDFNRYQRILVGYLRESGDNVPPWLRAATATLPQWRSIRRLVDLVRTWEKKRFAGDELILQVLSDWVKEEQHHWRWERHMEDQLRRHRRELYRCFAAKLVSRYSTIVLENFDLRDVAEKPEAEDGPMTTTKADWQRTVAAQSTLMWAIKSAARREGVRVVEKDPTNTTKECPVCEFVDKQFNAARHLIHICPRCGTKLDQDASAAQVLLKRPEGSSQKEPALAQR